jgi:hypothetical protein
MVGTRSDVTRRVWKSEGQWNSGASTRVSSVNACLFSSIDIAAFLAKNAKLLSGKALTQRRRLTTACIPSS